MVGKVTWNRNGNWLISGSQDQLIKIYDIRTMREVQSFRGHAQQVTCMEWHPVHEDFFASGSHDGAVCFWRVGEGEPVAAIPSAHQSAVWDLDWHPMGHILATSSKDQTTKFWTRQRPGDQMNDKYSAPGDDGGGGGRFVNQQGGRRGVYGKQRQNCK